MESMYRTGASMRDLFQGTGRFAVNAKSFVHAGYHIRSRRPRFALLENVVGCLKKTREAFFFLGRWYKVVYNLLAFQGQRLQVSRARSAVQRGLAESVSAIALQQSYNFFNQHAQEKRCA